MFQTVNELKGEIIELHKELASLRLENLQLENQWIMANRNCQHYMQEFMDRGLIYIPKINAGNGTEAKEIK